MLFQCFVAAFRQAPSSRHDVDDNAYRVTDKDYPFLFALYRTKAGHADCIATLIAPRWAITAAHCTEDKPFLAALQSGAGYEVAIAGRTFMIDRVERHPPAKERNVDLALVHFSQPVTHVKPAGVYRSDDEVGRVMLLPGWGGQGNGLRGLDPSPDGVFRIAENRVDAARDGLLMWEFDDPRSGIGRALPLEGISGPGDSGGPALVMTAHGWKTAGVSMAQRTFGRPEGLYGAEEIYVRLSAYAPWVDQIVRSAAE